MSSTLENFSTAHSSSSLLSSTSYPSDWSLFDTGDPAPGNPFDWSSIQRMWSDKARSLDQAQVSFHATGHISGEGYKVRYLNESLGIGADFVEQLRTEFERMGDVAQQWEHTLSDLQERAGKAHRLATEAHERIQESSAKITGLSDDLSLMKKESEKEQAHQKLDGLHDQLADAQQVLEHQRQVVRDIAGEYRGAASTARAEYVLASMGELTSLSRNHQGASAATLSKFSSGGALFDVSAEAMQGDPPVSFAQLKDLSDHAGESPDALKEYLSKVALLSPAELAGFAGQYPDVAHLPVPVSNDGVGNAQVVRDWWNVAGGHDFGLSAEQREVLIAQLPGFVGNLEGVRYADRDRANRVLLDFYVGHPELTSEYAKATLDLIKSVLNKEEKGVPRSLINLDLTNMDISTYDAGMGNVLPNDMVATDDVLTSIALGDLDQAEAVTVSDPGMLNHPLSSLDPTGGDMAGMGQSIYDDQKKSYAHQGVSTKHAVILNLNYVTPQSIDVLSMHDAEIASERNANSVDALNVLGNNGNDDDNSRKVYLWNHSYGSTTAGETIQKVDSMVSAHYNVGPAGWGSHYFDNPDAAALTHLAKDAQGRPQIFSTMGNADSTARLGEYGSGRFDPRALKNSYTISSEDSADGKYKAVTGHPAHPQLDQGVGYNSPGSNAYNNGILITTGQVQKISPDEIEFNVSQPDWVYDRAPLSGDNPASSHKDFVLSGSR